MAESLADKTLEDAFHEHLAAGDFRLQRCAACGRYRHPPRFACPQCLSREWRWEPVLGEGVIETHLWYCEPVDPRFTEVPYNVALVRLTEGPGLFANISDARYDDLAVGQRVQSVIGLNGDVAQLTFVRRSAR